MKRIYLIIMILFFSSLTSAQSLRNLVNDGVDSYEAKEFNKAEINFKKGLDQEFENFEAHFNLGSAQYKQERYEDALNAYKNAYSLAKDDFQKARVMHNIGNAFLKSQKMDEAIAAYKNSLRLNPDDLETKYNLSYAIQQKKQQQQQNKDQNKDDKNKDQDKKDKQNQDQKNQDQNKDQQKQQDQNKQDQQQQQQNQQQQQQKMSKEEAKRMLEALKNNEADLQKKLRKKKGKAVKREKDW